MGCGRFMGWVVLVLLLAPDAAPSQERPSAAALDSLVASELGARKIVGMVVGVVQSGDTLLLRAYGQADLEHEVPLNVDAVFQIASLTKQFTSVAVLQLAETGALDLDDDVRRYLPGLQTGGDTVRIRHLLNHTSGVPNVYEMTSWPSIRPLRGSRDEFRALEIAGVAEDSLDFAPGSDFHYSNTGYDLLGDVVEVVTGVSVEEHFRRTLFEPLGLERTSFCPWTRVVPDRARGYEPDSAGSHLENAWRQSQALLFTSGGICSTARDLLRWNASLHSGRVLHPWAYQAMTTPRGGASTYGFGLFVDDVVGHRRLRHNGYTPGFSAQLEHLPDDQLTVVVLANSPAAVVSLAEAIERRVLGLPARVVAVRPSGWIVRALAATADTASIHFRAMGGGIHVTAGAGAAYAHPDSVARGAYRLRAGFIGVGGSTTEGIGLLFAGDRELDGYGAFLVRGSGDYTVVRRTNGSDVSLIPWTASGAIAANGSNELEVEALGDRVLFRINGTKVAELPRERLGGANGVFGLRVGQGGDVHVSGIGSEAADSPSRSGSVAAVPQGQSEPTSSPDGSQIAFRGGEYPDVDIWAVRSDGTSPVQLTHDPAADHYPTWSPDGRRIAFVSNRSGDWMLYVMNADGSEVRALVTTSHLDDDPGPARVGRGAA